MKQIFILITIGIIILSGIGISTATPCSQLTNHQINQESNIKKKLEIPYMIVHVKEIYGTVDEPQYRPLANVTVRVRDSLFGIFWELTWSGTTDETGSTPIIWIVNSIKYWVTILKDDYHTYKCSSSKLISALGDWKIDVNFTMAEDGSPFIFSLNPSFQNQLNNQQSSHQVNQKIYSLVYSNSVKIISDKK